MGKDGAILLDKLSKVYFCPAFAKRAVDKVGSGDTMLTQSSLALYMSGSRELCLFLGSVAASETIKKPKIQETSTLKIFNCIINKNINETHNCTKSKKSLIENKIEFNKRFGMPIYIPLISLICAFLLTSRKDKKIYYYNKYIYFFICFLIFSFSEILVRYSGISWNHTSVYYLLPIGLLPFFYYILIKKFKYENLK